MSVEDDLRAQNKRLRDLLQEWWEKFAHTPYGPDGCGHEVCKETVAILQEDLL